jgi:hypothetical protein
MYLKKYQGALRPLSGAFLLFALLLSAVLSQAVFAQTALSDIELQRLEEGEVLLSSNVEGCKLPLVQGKILIKSKPDKVWSIVVNPAEVAGKIQKHIKKFRFLRDTPHNSVLDCQVEVASFLPRFNYVVESSYEPCKRIEFWRVGGALRDFRGYWLFEPRDNGSKTLVTYAMYLDPGFFVPQWIIKQGLRRELPETLGGIRARVVEIDTRAHAHALVHHSS